MEARVQAHRARFAPTHPSAAGGLRPTAGGWNGGFWLPECAHAPHLEPLLEEAGVRATCIELTNRHGLGASEHLRPLAGESGVVLVPIDRATIAHVWSDGGYPAHGSYRDYHHHTIHHHQPWANDGSDYDHELALGLAREYAADFVARTIERLRGANESPPQPGAGGRSPAEALPGGGLVVCALDTELLGHWWYEGVEWLRAVVGECSRQGLALVRLDEAQAMRDPAPLDDAEWEPSTWGKEGNLSTWSGPAVADMAFATRAAELRTLAAGRDAGAAALRELLALQSSDWAFMASRELAVPYARERFEGHRAGLEHALAHGRGAAVEPLRNLAVRAEPSLLLGP